MGRRQRARVSPAGRWDVIRSMRALRTVALALIPALLSAPSSAQTAWHDPSPHRVGFLSINGARLHYLDWGGHGPVLLLIHGWNSNAHVFDDLAPRLTDRYRVVGLTLRGFGESDTVPGSYSLARYADDLRVLLDSLRVQRATIAAHSFGGWVLTAMARRYPGRIDRAVYLDAAFDMHVSDSIVARRPVRRPALTNVRSSADVMRWLQADFFGLWTPALRGRIPRTTTRRECTRGPTPGRW